MAFISFFFSAFLFFSSCIQHFQPFFLYLSSCCLQTSFFHFILWLISAYLSFPLSSRDHQPLSSFFFLSGRFHILSSVIFFFVLSGGLQPLASVLPSPNLQPSLPSLLPETSCTFLHFSSFTEASSLSPHFFFFHLLTFSPPFSRSFTIERYSYFSSTW